MALYYVFTYRPSVSFYTQDSQGRVRVLFSFMRRACTPNPQQNARPQMQLVSAKNGALASLLLEVLFPLT